MYLLDIIVDYPHRPVRPVKPVLPPDTAKVPAEVPDTVVASDTIVTQPAEVPDTAHAVQSWLVGGTGDDSSMLLWGALVVVAALALCLWLARSYRRRLNAVR